MRSQTDGKFYYIILNKYGESSRETSQISASKKEKSAAKEKPLRLRSEIMHNYFHKKKPGNLIFLYNILDFDLYTSVV